jgi:hypothetical protein
MLQSTPMPCKEDSADARPCQQDDAAYAWTRPEIATIVDPGRVIAAVARAYNAIHPAAAVEVTPAAILGTSRVPDVAWARHLCAYVLVEDAKLTNNAAAQALGRTDHTTILNSRARVAAALGHDTALAATLARVRALLAGEAVQRSIFAGVTPAELAEYRYWRQRSLQAGYVW